MTIVVYKHFFPYRDILQVLGETVHDRVHARVVHVLFYMPMAHKNKNRFDPFRVWLAVAQVSGIFVSVVFTCTCSSIGSKIVMRQLRSSPFWLRGEHVRMILFIRVL